LVEVSSGGDWGGTSELSQETLQMGPLLYKRDWWVSYQYNSLTSEMHDQLKVNIANAKRTFGSHGTGANGFLEALRGIEAFDYQHLHPEGGGLSVDNVFGSEVPGSVGDAACRFIMTNDPPQILYRGLRLKGCSGTNSLTGEVVQTPSTDLYGAAPACKDIPEESESSDPTSMTMAAIYEYWDKKEPAFTVIEAMAKDEIVRELYMLFRQHDKPYFDVEIFETNTQFWKLPHFRNRIFLVAVNLRKVKLLQPVHLWQEHLVRMMHNMPKMSVQDFLIDQAQDSVEVSLLLSNAFGEMLAASKRRTPTETLLHQDCVGGKLLLGTDTRIAQLCLM